MALAYWFYLVIYFVLSFPWTARY